MKPSPFLPCLGAILLACPVLARADANPDFEHDAKPILAEQPGLVQYVQSHFVVKETGVARVPGSEAQPPQPPFIFSARPRGHAGPFYLRLLIQPGPAGHILKVANIRKLPNGTPEPTPVPEQPEETAQAPAPQPPAESSPQPIGSSTPSSAPAENPAASSNSQPSASTPSGPIRD
jgi:hypothetical protein